MDKNLFFAIVLSTLVILGTFILQPILFPASSPTVETTTTEEVVENENVEDKFEALVPAEFTAAEDVDSVEVEEVIVETNLAKIKLTSKGGDITSYELIKHFDLDTNKGVELVANTTENNHAAAIAIGNAGSKILTENFSVQKIDNYTVLFKKNVVINSEVYTIGKKYTFMPDEYMFKLEILIHSNSNAGLNSNGVAYTICTSPQVGPNFDPKQNRYDVRQYVAYNGSKYKKIVLSSGQFKDYNKDFIWNGIAGKYFVELMIPENSGIIKSGYYSSKVETENKVNAQAFIERRGYTGSDIQDTYYMYYGPRNDKDLKRYNVADNNAWNFGGKKLTECLQTSGILNWMEKILKAVLEIIYKVIPNWGASIIVMTILLKLILFPLSKKQSMSTLKMQEIQPKVTAIQEKYKNDQKRLQIEMSKLYQEAGYNPMSGCLPLIFQFVILISMYNMFNNYFEFRGAMFIPGWINDLSSGDTVHTLKFNLWMLGNQIRILPIIYVATQLLFGKITNNGGMNAGGQSAATMKFMTYGMPLFFFFLFYNAPSGLLLYWTVSNIIQMIQQIIINKIMKAKKAELQAKKETKKLPPKAKK